MNATTHNVPSPARPRPALAVVVWRSLCVALHILLAVMLASVYPLMVEDRQRRLMQWWSGKLLQMLRVGLLAQGNFHREELQGRLLVANHVSWLDAIVMNAVAPASFVVKSEVAGWPVLGWLCRRSGNLFIRRDMRRDAARVNGEVAGLLAQGKTVALFPEGTSTDADVPGHFHSSLLQGAIEAHAAVCPVAIRYHDSSGAACRDAAYVGNMSFAESLWKILCSPSLQATLYYLPVQPAAGRNRRVLAAAAQGEIHRTLAHFSSHHSVFVPGGGLPPLPAGARVPATQA